MINNAIDFIWVKTPTFLKNKKEASNDAFITFLNYVPYDIFNLAKPFWQGNVNYLDKKQSVYRVELIETLLKETYIVNIEGTIISQSVQNYPGTHIVNKIINISEDSLNDKISFMARKQRKYLIYSQVIKELWSLFQTSETIGIEENNSKENNNIINPFKTGEWTTVIPFKKGKEFDFNLNEGLLHYEINKKDYTEHKVSKLKNESDLIKLIKLVNDLKKYGYQIAKINDVEHLATWKEGFDINNTYLNNK